MSIHNKISVAKIEDTDAIMKFIDNEWKQGHILGNNKDYFLYEYKNNDHLNFVISKNKDHEINGMLGFLKASSENDSTVWTTMWKVSKSSGSPMLGIDLLAFLRRQGYKSVMSIGINMKTKEIYNYLGFHVGILDHYFIPNQKINKNKISIIPDRIIKKNISHRLAQDLIFKKVEYLDLKKYFDFNKYNYRIPCKDLNYFNHRYYQHPIYHYDIYGCYNGFKLGSIAVVRISKHLDSSCLRIVDFYGDENFLYFIAANLMEIMYSDGHEYIDFICLGLSKEIMLKAGFLKVNCNEKYIVIPNYFEPFVQSNITISYFTDSQNLENLRICKADGDQDRPSSINNSEYS